MRDAEPRHGGALLVECLLAQGVERAFCVPGESYLAVLDALHDAPVDLVVARQEGGAAMMAEATGKLTGRPGVAMVTRGPGATNASAGVHVARQDSTPMLLLVGQVPRGQSGREAFQEVDLPAAFAPLAKWAAEVRDPERIPEYVSRAFHVARSGRPGPVVLSLPEDVLSGPAEGEAAPEATLPSGLAPEADLEALVERLALAERPLAVVGGPWWSAEAAGALERFAEAAGVPVATSFRRQDRMDNLHPLHAGHLGLGAAPALARRVEEADVLLVLGARLGEIATAGYARPVPPAPHQALLHVHPDPDEMGRVYRPEMAVLARADRVAAQLAAAARPPTRDRFAWLTGVAEEREAWRAPGEGRGALRMEAVIAHLGEALPSDAVLTNGAGNYAAWLHRHHAWRRFGTQLAPTSGSMGYGLPAAVAAKLHAPGREVVCLAGDGCFQMTGQELATACERGLGVVVLVCDNGQYGTIRMHQERHHPGRPSGTRIANPDFAALARAHGAFAETVERDEEFADALAAARAAGGPALLHLRLDPDALAPGLTAG